MADTDTDHERQAPEHGAAGGTGFSRKWHGVPLWGWTLGVTVAAVVAFKWWRGRSSGAAGSSSTGTGTSTLQNCYDISGALVPCAQAAANNAAGGGDLGGTLGGILTGSSSSGTGTGTGGSSSSGTGTGTGPPTSGRLTPPLGLHLTVDGATGVRVNWLPVPGATGYVALCKKGGDNGQIVNGPFAVQGNGTTRANFGGLAPSTSYTALIWPSSATIAGGPGSDQPHAEYAFKTPKKS